MPAFEVFDLNQKAVLWPTAGPKDRYGVLQVGDPVEIFVRWENTRCEMLNSKGEVIGVDASVVTDRDITVGSRMWLGELADWYGTGSGVEDDEVMQVLSVEKATDLKGRILRRELLLCRYKNAPTA